MVWWPWYHIFAASEAVYQAGGIVVAGVVAATGSWFITRRTTSGSVSKSNATDLWEESRSIRRDLSAALDQERKDRSEERTQLRLELHEAKTALASETAERRRLEDVVRDQAERIAVLESRDV